MKNKAQTWSFDLIVAVVLFVVVIGLFYGFMIKDQNESTDKLLDETKLITYKLDCTHSENQDNCVLDSGNTLNETKLIDLYDSSYEGIKSQFGLESEFCIYVRDLNGNLIPINSKTGFGSSDLILTESGKTCSELIVEGVGN